MKIIPLCLLSFFVSFSSYAQDKSDTLSLYEQAEKAYNAGDVNTAIIHVKNQLLARRDDLSARLLFAKILLESGELAAAEEQYERALALNADKSLVIIPLAKSLLLQNKAQEIIDVIQIGDFEPSINTFIYVYRAKAFLLLQDRTSAEEHFNLALGITPDNLDALLGLSSVALQQNNIPLVKSYIAQAKKIAPESSHVWYFEGEMYRRLGDKANALKAYETALELNADNYDALRSRATIQLDNGELALAKADLDRVLAHTPTDPVAKLLTAMYLSKVDKASDAKRLVSEVNDKFNSIDSIYLDQFSPLLLISGMSQYMAGNYQDASKNLTLFLKQDPNNSEAREVLAEIAYMRGQPEKVIKLLQPIELQFISSRSALLLVTAFLSAQQYQEGLTIIERLPETIVSQLAIQKMKAVLLVKSGNLNAALQVLTEQAQQGAKKDVLLMLGYSYLELAMFDDAKSLAIKLSAEKNLSLEALNYIATVHLAHKEYDQAEKYYRIALSNFPNDEIVNLNLSQLLIKFERFDEADNILSRMAEKKPQDINILPVYGHLLEQQGRYPEAIDVYETLETLKPEHLSYKYKLANLYLREKQLTKAIDTAQAINKIQPLSPTAMIIKAKAYLQQKDREKAQRTLRIVVGLFTKNSQELVEIAKLQLQAQDWQYLEQTLELIEGLTPGSEDVVLINAAKLEAMGKSKQALKQLQAINVKSSDVNHAIASLYFKQGAYAKAKPFAERSFQQVKNESNNLLLVKIYWQLTQRDKALLQFNTWLKQQPSDWKGFRLYANLLTIDNNNREAITAYEQALLIKPDDVFSLNNLALLFLEENELTQALTYAEKALAAAPLDAKVNDTYGWILVANERYDEGLQYLRESYSRDVKSANTLYHIGLTLGYLGRDTESLETLKRALGKTQSVELIHKIELAITELGQ